MMKEKDVLLYHRLVTAVTVCLIHVTALPAQQRSLLDSISYRVELQTSLSAGDNTPLWLNANRYGLSSLDKSNGYLRGALERPLSLDDDRKWGVGFGLDAAVAAGFTSTLIVQQAYVEGRWLKALLTVGAKEQPMELKNRELSSGSQTFGINARPVPQVRLSIPEFWTVPGTRNWLALKGHIAYGITTDGGWQKDFSHQKSRYTENTLYHSKAGYLKIGPGSISFTLGMEMGCQFGGTSYLFEDGGQQVYDNPGKIGDFFRMLVPGGNDAMDGDYINAEGNHLGSWVMRFDIVRPEWSVGIYADQFFEDSSMLTHLTRKRSDGSGWYMYDFKDWLLGAELRLSDSRWIEGAVLEYLYTKYQGGPVYHDPTPNVDVRLCGRDNYYNHHLFTGWQHWGQVMGNPLYVSPLYNGDGKIEVEHNRLVAWHLGLSGTPAACWHWRMLASWQKSYGSYYYLPVTPLENLSLMAEVVYSLPRCGWSFKGAAGLDSGKLRGDNFGLQLTAVKTGMLSFRGGKR